VDYKGCVYTVSEVESGKAISGIYSGYRVITGTKPVYACRCLLATAYAGSPQEAVAMVKAFIDRKDCGR